MDDGFFPIELPKPFRLVVTGDREWKDGAFVYNILAQLDAGVRIECLIHGGCRGLDVLAGEAAKRLRIPVRELPVTADEWRGRPYAGNLRNQAMLDRHAPHAWLGFHDDFARSRGTRDMVLRCRKANLPGKLLSHDDRTLPEWLTC